jgi:copper chaperone
MQTEHLNIAGMSCGGYTSKVTHALQAVTGVSDVIVSLAAGEATVQYDERLTSPEQLKAAVKGAGYGVDGTDTARAAAAADTYRQQQDAKSNAAPVSH